MYTTRLIRANFLGGQKSCSPPIKNNYLITKRFSKEKHLFKVRKKVSKHIWTNRKSCNDFRPTFDYLTNRTILNNKRWEVGNKRKSLLFWFLLLSCFYISRLSVSVSRVCAPTLPLTYYSIIPYHTIV